MAATTQILRKPFQGVGNIIRFNWHFFVFSLLFLIALFISKNYTSGLLQWLTILAFWGDNRHNFHFAFGVLLCLRPLEPLRIGVGERIRKGEKLQ